RRERRERRWFEDQRVACQEGGNGFEHVQQERVVVGRNAQYHTERIVYRDARCDMVRSGGIEDVFLEGDRESVRSEVCGQFQGVVGCLQSALELGDVEDRLGRSGFRDEQRADLLGMALDGITQAAKIASPFLYAHARPWPLVKGFSCRSQRVLDIIFSTYRRLADGLFRRRVDDGFKSAIGSDPLATDV